MGVTPRSRQDAEYFERAGQKVTKDGDTLTLVLKKTPDILAELGRCRRG